MNRIRLGNRQVETTSTTRKRSGQKTARNVLTIPHLVDIDPAKLAPLPASVAADGLLLASARGEDIALTLATIWDDSAAGDSVEFFIKKPGETELTSVHKEDFGGGVPTVPITFNLLAADHDLEGVYELTYVVTYGGGGSGDSFITPLATDYTAPGASAPLSALGFDDADEIETKGIRPAIFRDPGDGSLYLWAEVYSYESMDGSGVLVTRGDMVDLEANGAPLGSPSEVVAVDGHLEVRIKKSDLEALGDVDSVTFVYHITDRAGNPSLASHPKTVSMVLTEIGDLEAPAVPAYDDDSAGEELIDEADARGTGNLGFIVEVIRHSEMKDGDQILLHMGGRSAGPADIGADDPIEIHMPYVVSQAVWAAGSSGGTTDTVVDANVSYSLVRGASEIGTSPDHAIKLNLFTNVTDPKPETPENEGYRLPVVVSFGGTEDRIPLADFGKDGHIEVVPLANPPATGNALKEGDVLKVHYSTETLDDFPVPPITDPAEPLEIPLPGDKISNVGSGSAIPVWYEVVVTLAGGGSNIGLSGKKEIPVEGTDKQPGRGHLDAGTFPEATLDGGTLIPRSDLEDGTPFVIPDYENRDPDDDIVLDVKYYLPGVVAPGHDTGGDTELPQRHFTIAQQAGSAPNPIPIPIPKANLVQQPWPDGLSLYMHAHVTYTITKRSGDTTPVTSDESFVRVDGRGNPTVRS